MSSRWARSNSNIQSGVEEDKWISIHRLDVDGVEKWKVDFGEEELCPTHRRINIPYLLAKHLIVRSTNLKKNLISPTFILLF